MEFEKIIECFIESRYSVVADGMRFIDGEELSKILEILLTNETSDIKKSLDELFKTHPETIKLWKENKSGSCVFNKDLCDCWHPDIDIGNIYCKRKKRKNQNKHNVRGTQKYIDWRASVFNRDQFKCQVCGKVGGSLHAHHIKSYAEYKELRLDINNGITLCANCHIAEHKRIMLLKKGCYNE